MIFRLLFEPTSSTYTYPQPAVSVADWHRRAGQLAVRQMPPNLPDEIRRLRPPVAPHDQG
jgi:hypothetical protein